MENATQTKVWNAGVPTAADVNAVLEKAGEITVGMVIEHDTISSTIGVPVHSHRYQTVVAALKREVERKHHLVLGNVPTVGYKVLNEDERVDAGCEETACAVRRVRRASYLICGADRKQLSQEHRDKQTRMMLSHAQMLGAEKIRKASMQVMDGLHEEAAKLLEA